MVEKRVKKFGQGFPPPLFGQCLKENIFLQESVPKTCHESGREAEAMEEKTRNCGSWGRSPRQEGGGTQEEIAKDVGQDCRNQKEKVRQTTI